MANPNRFGKPNQTTFNPSTYAQPAPPSTRFGLSRNMAQRQQQPQHPPQQVYHSTQSIPQPIPRAQISDDQIYLIKEAFKLFDTDKDGYLDQVGLGFGASSLNIPLQKDEITAIIQRHGTLRPFGPPSRRADGSENTFRKPKIDESTFIDVMADALARQTPEDRLMTSFKGVDEDNRGYITAEDILRTLSTVKDLEISDDIISLMINEFDTDGDGGVTFEEFADMIYG